MGKVKKAVKLEVAKPLVLNRENKITKGKASSKKTLKEQIRKTLGVKEPKKASLKTEQKRLAAVVQKTTAVQVTKKSKNLQGKTSVSPKKSVVESKKSPKGLKRKQKSVEESSTPGKYVLLAGKAATPEKQETPQRKRLETRFKIEESAVKSAFKAVQKLLEEQAKKHNKLFDDDQPILLQVTSVKVPKCPPRIARLSLKHSLFANGGDICFIAVDIPKTDLEEVRDHYETLFANKGIRNIKTIIPLKQLRTEYGDFELRRRLVELYDVFLVDGRISGRVSRSLGSIFYQKRKLPAPIKFNDKNLERNVKKALLKTPFHIHPKGDTFVVQVCHSGMTEQQKIANFWSVIQGIDKEFPGRWENVKSLHLKGTSTMSVPVYLNLISKSEIKTPVIKSKRPKAFVSVSDELSTKYNQKVIVHPTGEVETQPLKEKLDSVENLSDEESEIASDEENDGYSAKKPLKKADAESDEESEIEYTQEELSYLQEMQTNKKKKKTPGVKQKKQKAVNEKKVEKQKGKQKKFAKRNRK